MKKLPLLFLFALASCTLKDVQVAEPENVVVAEIMLRAGDRVQTAVLHRTLVGAVDSTNAVIGAVIEVTNAAGSVLRFNQTADSICIVPRMDSRGLVRGTCYASPQNPRYDIMPGQTYSLKITLKDGGVMTGQTHVPADFKMLRPAAATCILSPDDTLHLTWTKSADAWVYASGGIFRGIRAAFAARGITTSDEPLRLFGLSISNSDTTIVFPGEFGLFDRFDDNKIDVLAAMQKGLPPNVTTDVTVAAADGNYVNWERGGNFNPSGQVRVPSIRGAGTGVFGSLVPKPLQIRTTNSTTIPRCK